MTKRRKTDYEVLLDAGVPAAEATRIVLAVTYGSPEAQVVAQTTIDNARASRGLKLRTLKLTMAHRVTAREYRPAKPVRLTFLGIDV